MASNVKLSTGMRNQKLDGGIGSIFDGGKLQIYDGAQPASPNDVVGAGTLLAEITLPTPAFAAASGGSRLKAGTWEDLLANASGTPTWARLITSTDTGVSSTTEKRIDVSAGLTGGAGFDLEFTAALVINEPLTIDSFTLTEPAA